MIAWVEAQVSKHPPVRKKKTPGANTRMRRTYIFKERVLKSHPLGLRNRFYQLIGKTGYRQ